MENEIEVMQRAVSAALGEVLAAKAISEQLHAKRFANEESVEALRAEYWAARKVEDEKRKAWQLAKSAVANWYVARQGEAYRADLAKNGPRVCRISL